MNLIALLEIHAFNLEVFHLSEVNVLRCTTEGVPQALKGASDGHPFFGTQVQLPHCGGLIIVHVPAVDVEVTWPCFCQCSQMLVESSCRFIVVGIRARRLEARQHMLL